MRMNALMKNMKPTTRARLKTRMAKGRMKWGLGKWRMKRQARKVPLSNRTWMGIAGGLLGGAAGLAAFFAVRKNRGWSRGEKHPQSGQAPGRSHIQMSSHPAAQSRFEPLKRRFGR